MNILRMTFAVALVVLAVVLIAGETLLIVERASIHALDYAVGFIFVFCCLATSAYCFRPKVFWDDRIACPACHREGTLRLAIFGQPRLSVLGWIAGGFVGGLIFTLMRKRRFRCEACGEPSNVRTVGGWIASAWLIYFVFALVAAICVHGDF